MMLCLPYVLQDLEGAKNQEVIDVTVGDYPSQLSINTHTNIIYVYNTNSKFISIINGTNDKNVGTIPWKNISLTQITDLAVNNNTNKIYAVDMYNNNVTIINASTKKIVKDIRVGKTPESVAINPITNLIYVSERDHNTLSIINGSTDEVIKKLDLGFNATDVDPFNTDITGLTINPLTNKIYVAVGYNKEIAVIDGKTNEIWHKIKLGYTPSADIAVNTKTNKIYGMLDLVNRIYTIDGNTDTLATTFINGNTSSQTDVQYGNTVLDVDPNTDLVFVTNKESNTVSILNGTNGLITEVGVGNAPVGVVVNPNTKKVYVSNVVSDSVSVFGESILKNAPQAVNKISGIRMEDSPIDIAVNPISNLIYVTTKDKISAIEGINYRVLKTITVNDPTSMSFNPNTNKLYVANRGNDTLSVIDGLLVKSKNIYFSRGFDAEEIGIDLTTNTIFVINWDESGNNKYITQINGTTDQIIADTNANYYLVGGEISPKIYGNIEKNDTKYDEIYMSLFNNLVKLTVRTDLQMKYNNTTIRKSNEVDTNSSFLYKVNFNERTNFLYLLTRNGNQDFVYVIDLFIDKIIASIPVGGFPSDLDINTNTMKIYVTNENDDSVYVIDGLHNVLLDKIKVDDSPSNIAINPTTNIIYITNTLSKSVSTIDGLTNKVIIPISFDVRPANTGHIVCGKQQEMSTNIYFNLAVSTRCVAEPNNGFQFSSWTQIMDKNSTKTISVSHRSSLFDPLLKAFGLNQDENSAELIVSQYGNYTAYFKELPSPIPPEYLTGLYTIVISSIVGYSIPGIISSVKTKRQLKNVDLFHKEMTSIYDDKQFDEKDIRTLDRLKRDISDAYPKGKINSEHYSNLNNEISILYQEVFKKEIDLLNSLTNNEDKINLLNKVQSDIEDAYSKEKVTEKHYNLLKEKISGLENTKNNNENNRK